jgi:hypothetical protein
MFCSGVSSAVLPASPIWRRASRWSMLRDGMGTVGGIADFGGPLATISALIVAGCRVAATHTLTPVFAATVILLVALRIRVLLGRMEPIAEPE